MEVAQSEFVQLADYSGPREFEEECSMPQDVQVGTIMMSDWPQIFGLQSEPYSAHWTTLLMPDGFALDRKIRSTGWNFFFVASEVKVMFLGALGPKKIRHALSRILANVSQQHFNGLEVTGIVAKRFLGIPYAVVTGHSRHVQQSCYLDNYTDRQASHEAELAHAV
jgi:hypothetical protein